MKPGSPSQRRSPVLCGTLLFAAMSVPALADDHVPMPPDAPPAYRQECGSCHIAYAPALLPAPSWQRLMIGLDRHFGSNASLDAVTTRQIADWLQTHAATRRRQGEAPPQDRITRAAWFQREHRKLDAAVWTLPSVASAANCGACHAQAERGRFGEHELRVPAGLDARQRRAFDD